MITGNANKWRSSLATRFGIALVTFATGLAVNAVWIAALFHPIAEQNLLANSYTTGEEYAVYSSVINHIHNEDRFRFFVIRDRTFGCMRGEWCKPQLLTRQLEGLIPETLEDYVLHNNQPTQLSNSFSLRATAVTLNDADLPKFLAGSKSRINLSPIPNRKINWGEFYSRYGLSPGLISLSRVGFNSELNQALVYEETQANYNGTWCRYVLLTKRTGMWTVQGQHAAWFPEEPPPSEKQGEFGTLKGRLLDAKAEGEDRVELSILACGRYIGNLQEALSRDTVVLAELVGKKTYQDRYGLYTWYRFKTREALVKNPYPRLGFSPFGDAPSDMLPIAENEFLIRETNGQMEMDGVTVIQRSNGAEYSVGQTYLLFIWIEPSKRIAIRSGTDPLGVFSIDSEGTLKAYVNRPYPLKDQIAKRFGNSIDKLRKALKKT
jgi:hypothetical protein